MSKSDGQYTNILNEKKNIVEFLKSELEIKSDQLMEMNNEMLSLVTLNEANKNEHKNNIEALNKAYNEKLDESTSIIEKLGNCRLNI